MASTYTALKAQIIDWALPGGEPSFEGQVPEFIRLAEARFDRELRVQNMIGVSTLVTSEPFPAVPSDWLETITILDASGTPLKSLTIHQRDELNQATAGIPAAYAMVDGGFRFIPSPNAERSYQLTYYRKLDRLSDTNTSNWLLDVSPDLYLYASLVAAEVYLKSDERFPLWASQSQKIIDDMNAVSLRQEYARGTPLARRVSFG